MTSPSRATRYPTTPCSAGTLPVARLVRAQAVVLGATEVIGPPTPLASTGARARRSCSCSSPRPSITRSTTCPAPLAGSGNHAGSGLAPGVASSPSRAGTTRWRHAPSQSGKRGVGWRAAWSAPGSAVDSVARATTPSLTEGHPTTHAAPLPTKWPVASHLVRVSTRGDYASRALLSLALHGAEMPTSVKDIAVRTGLPQPYLEQILLALKGAGLVRSKRGVGGGYVLARPPEEISLAQIVSAVDGPIAAGDFGEPHENGACDHEGQCVLLAVWADVGETIRTHLQSYSLADMVDRAQGTAVATV